MRIEFKSYTTGCDWAFSFLPAILLGGGVGPTMLIIGWLFWTIEISFGD